MKKIAIGIIIILVIASGAYLLLHKSSKSSGTTTVKTANGTTVISKNVTPPASDSSVVFQTKISATLGTYLADGNGRALYVYDSDTAGVSNCTGSCATTWPPYLQAASSKTSTAGTIKRADGSLQHTYNSKPLYYYSGDTNGSITGDGIGGFHIAKP